LPSKAGNGDIALTSRYKFRADINPRAIVLNTRFRHIASPDPIRKATDHTFMTPIDEKSDDEGAARPGVCERTQPTYPSQNSTIVDVGSDISESPLAVLDPPRPMRPSEFVVPSRAVTDFPVPRPLAPLAYGLPGAIEDADHNVSATIGPEQIQDRVSEFDDATVVEHSEIASAVELKREPELEPQVPTRVISLDDQPTSAAHVDAVATFENTELSRPTGLQGVPAQPQDRSWIPFAKKIAKIAVGVAAVWLTAIVVLIFAYRFIDPPLSSLMVQQRLSGQEITQDWVPLELISNNVVRAVMLSEDGRFCQHSGVDFEEMQNAIERAGDGTPRGASTISMQVIKNLFLWPSRSYVRKVIEIPMTWLMELVWPKARIMEVYLNIAEWGPGIFGVEAASQFHFNKSANRLNEREAARLAVALPNPMLRDAGDPGPKTRRLASDIQARMRAAYLGQTACVKVERRFEIERDNPADNGWRPVVRPSG
jgi:monofunctional biosynthetic peptidoglycan transglycosylase